MFGIGPTDSMNVASCSLQPHRLTIPARMTQVPMFRPRPASVRISSVGFKCGSINWLVGSVMHRKASFRYVRNVSELEKETSFSSDSLSTLEAQSWSYAVLVIDLFQPLTLHIRISACNRCQWEDLKNIVQSECHWPKHRLSNRSAWIFAGTIRPQHSFSICRNEVGP